MSALTDNEVLAEFNGGKFEKAEVMTYGGKRTGKWTFDDGLWCYDDQLDYSTDWRRLMPVWYKFRDLQFGSFGHHNTWLEHKDFVSYAILNQGCAEACKLLANAIRWYQQTQKVKI
jgi:hypothetical protein